MNRRAKRYFGIFIAIVLVVVVVLCLGLIGLKDAQNLDSTVTFADNFVSNMSEPWFKILAVILGLTATGIVAANEVKKQL